MASDPIDHLRATQSLKDLFSRVPLFNGFPENIIDELKGATSVVKVAPDCEILKQGEINKNLFFLVIGTVDIYVDGGLVATLRRKGDLLGEMSVITNKPCSATIIAKTPVELICVNTEEFKRLTGNDVGQFNYILYRIYATILTDKINITNQRAKRLEGTLEDLNRAKNELQEINTQLERRVAERTQHLQAKLQEFLTKHLLVLSSALQLASDQASSQQKAPIEKGLHEVKEVINFLEPLVQRFNLEISLKTKRVLLAQSERKLQTVSKMALGGTGINIEVADTSEVAMAILGAQKIEMILIDSGSLDLVEKIQKLPSQPQIVYVASKAIQENLVKLLLLPTLPNIVFLRDEDRVGQIRAIMTTVTKLCSRNIFGLEKYLNVGAEIKELKVRKSTERQDLNSGMCEYFSNLGIRKNVLEQVGTVLEELLMNAIYDAPTDASGTQIYNKLPRTTVVDLKAHEQGTFRFACDGALLAISVEDPFGALTGKTIMSYLDSCYGGRAGQMQQDKGGAGRGLHQIVENSEFVVFNVHPGRRTEVIACFDLIPGPKESKGPLLHYFVQDQT